MKFRLLALFMMFVMLLTACGGQAGGEVSPSPSATDPAGASPSPEQSQPPLTDDETANPLTGLPLSDEAATNRPIAVMMNNVREAMPQLGNSQADIIYEACVEGGITRLLAVYQSVEDVGVIGSVRSARPDFIELVAGHDAILLHAGGSDEAYHLIDTMGISAFDCVRAPLLDKLFWRDSDRLASMSIEHTLVTSGEWIEKYLPTTGVRLTHEDDFKYEMTFVEDGTPANGETASTIQVPFSNYKTGVFTYDEKSGKYLVEQYGEEHVDGTTGEQLAITNVIVLRTEVTVTDSIGHVAMDLTEGDGWYACGGKIIPIKWSKDGFSGQLVYKTTDGQELALSAGNSYVSIIPLRYDIKVQ